MCDDLKSKAVKDTLEIARVQAETSKLLEEQRSRIEYREADICHRNCLCDAIKRLPWERAKHVCLNSDGNITDVDFFSACEFMPPAP
jgi:hypothetical protein